MNLDGDPVLMTPIKVLVIEDDPGTGAALVESLERVGIQTVWAAGGAEGLRLKRSFRPDIVLVDLHLPDTDGLGLVALLARQRDCGIIIVSGLVDEAERIVALEIGADDYVAKPPQMRELLARIRALHRRMRVGVSQPLAAITTVDLGGLTVDLVGRSVRSAKGDRVMLTAAEFKALETMLAASGESVSRDRISKAALQRPWRVDDRSVDQLIFNLRQKLRGDDDRSVIHSIRGAGYMVSVGPGLSAAAV